MGGQRHQSNSTGSALFDHPGRGSVHNAGPASDTQDAVMARWLQSAGLQHLASPLASSGSDHRLHLNHGMQGYGTQSVEENQELYKPMRSMNFNAELVSDPCTLTAQTSDGMGASDRFHFSDFKGEFGAGLLDLHAMDDTELLTENVISEGPFELSPFMLGGSKAVDNDYNLITGRKQMVHTDTDTENSAKESNVAKIKVVVRKRPLNKKELSRKEDDIVSVSDNAYLTVHETKLKVDLTAYLEKHEFCFDAVLNDHVTNDEVYRETVQPIIPTIFQRTKATCFAYGQTGSGKTFTMQPLPIRAAEDIVRLLYQPTYRNQKLKLWLSYFEIYGGKLFDLLNDRKKLCMREDGRQQVCIVGLEEFEVLDVQIVKEYIEKGNASRSTGSTGANEESSRSHAILQLAVKKPNEIKDNRRNNDGNEPKSGKVVGKISFIDLAGSERGADTTDNDRQTRIEGAEINKSLLALKECIRALDNDQIHIPFRGSKLTEVLRDSFVGNSRTVMISCVSPNAGSCEHTLNTLRYADRVKSLSKSGNIKKDVPTNSVPSSFVRESVSGIPVDVDDDSEQHLDTKAAEKGIKGKESFIYGKRALNGREDGGMPTFCMDKEANDAKNMLPRSTSQKTFVSYSRGCSDMEENVQMVSPTRRKPPRDEKTERLGNLFKKDGGFVSSEQQNLMNSGANNVGNRPPGPPNDGNVTVLEEEVALIAAHRNEIEETMEIVREEMKLLAEVEASGSVIDNYVGQLSLVLSRKAAGLVSLQARLARFQNRLKEHEILSRKRVPR